MPSGSVSLSIGLSNVYWYLHNFVGSAYRDLSEVSLSVDIRDGHKEFLMPFLVERNFELKFEINSLNSALTNIERNHALADSAFLTERGELVELDGLIGVDIIQYFTQFSLTKCMNGSAFVVNDKLIPFGNVDNFLTKKQFSDKYVTENNSCDFQTFGRVDETLINCVFEPSKDYFDPIESVVADNDIDGCLDSIFKIESIGIVDDDVSDFDRTQIETFKKGISLKDGKYHVVLPWYPDKLDLVKSHFGVAKAVLNKVVRNLREKSLFDTYNGVFEQQLSDNILEELNFDDINIYNHIWIPHRPVLKFEDQVTTKVRPVLNCSLRTGSDPSLNMAAYPGVDLLSNLISLLFRVRTNDYMVMSDIRQAFLQIRLASEKDKNRFSILWQTSDGKLRAFRYNTIVFGLSASPFILNFVIKHHLSQFGDDLVSKILNSHFYVDNLFCTSNDVAFLQTFYKQSCTRMMQGGFELRSWTSNNDSLRALFVSDGKGTSHNAGNEKVLGYSFKPDTDQMFLAAVNKFDQSRITKRTMLSFISRAFDPLGLYLPVSVRGKVILRKLWQQNVDWDIELQGCLRNSWLDLAIDLALLSRVTFPRKVAISESLNILVICCDASKEAYGFTSYCVSEDGSNLLFAKTKVAPLKEKTLPTLELLAIYLSLKCVSSQLKVQQLAISELFICSDSQVALSWVLSGNVNSRNIFTRNRIRDILCLRERISNEYGIECLFRYIPTDSNPADMLTRGLSLTNFESKLELWKHGPSFIGKLPIIWPSKSVGCFSDLTKTLVSCTVNDSSSPILPIDRYSCLNKLLRVTAHVMRFVNLMRRTPCDPVIVRENARVYWIQFVQSFHFRIEMEYLGAKVKSAAIPVLVKNLNLFLDDSGLLRSRGRLQKCVSTNYDQINPILLPRDSYFSELFVRDFHLKCKHLGVSTTLNMLRNSGYWLPKGRYVVKRILSECVLCKKINAFHYKYPKRTDFVADRVNFVTPFRYTGVDYTGHFFVKFGSEIQKMYLLIFTCLNIRAVHIELVQSMSTADFLLAFIKFVNIYNMPKSLYSDNASTFSNASKIINLAASDDPLNEYLTKNSIKHVKIPVYSAWVGSAWERLIRTIKQCIYKCVGRKKLEFFQFTSLLTDVQHAVNSRPLTYRDSDVHNLDIITPNSFLKLDASPDMDFGCLDGSDLQLSNRTDLISSLNRRDTIFAHFKELWFSSYLLSLRESSRDVYDSSWHEKIKVGDVVLLYNPVKLRSRWSMGRVMLLLTGDDGRTRCARVRRGDSSEEVYSINHLYPLELSLIEWDAGTSAPDLPTGHATRPRRAAADKCNIKLKSLYN